MRTALLPLRLGVHALIMTCAAAAVIVGLLALEGPSIAWGQDESACEVIDLGTLSAEADSKLTTDGRWTTEDCDSRFRIGEYIG